jgi:hypothetical protein
MTAPVTLPQALLDAPVAGRNLPGTTLGACLDRERPTLLAFLRHFG